MYSHVRQSDMNGDGKNSRIHLQAHIMSEQYAQPKSKFSQANLGIQEKSTWQTHLSAPFSSPALTARASTITITGSMTVARVVHAACTLQHAIFPPVSLVAYAGSGPVAQASSTARHIVYSRALKFTCDSPIYRITFTHGVYCTHSIHAAREKA
jgi:hypothetical protein